ncbi:MAG: hypothetical protein ABJF23_19615 [Bryobacteraceae bacterium]
MLIWIKILHTAVWFFFAACIVALPIAGVLREFWWAGALACLVLMECAVLAVNRCRCPLTDLAARHTDVRTSNFDIYLPVWLARWNKQIFGTLFVAGGGIAIWQWLIYRGR